MFYFLSIRNNVFEYFEMYWTYIDMLTGKLWSTDAKWRK